MSHYEENQTDAPKIESIMVICSFFPEFWGIELWSSGEFAFFVFKIDTCTAEIDKLCFECFDIEDYIFIFEVSMRNSTFLENFEHFQNLREDGCC